MQKEKQLHIRVTDDEKKRMEENAMKMGFRQLSEYIRFLGLSEPIRSNMKIKNIDGNDVVDQFSIELDNGDI